MYSCLYILRSWIIDGDVPIKPLRINLRKTGTKMILTHSLLSLSFRFSLMLFFVLSFIRTIILRLSWKWKIDTIDRCIREWFQFKYDHTRTENFNCKIWYHCIKCKFVANNHKLSPPFKSNDIVPLLWKKQITKTSRSYC